MFMVYLQKYIPIPTSHSCSQIQYGRKNCTGYEYDVGIEGNSLHLHCLIIVIFEFNIEITIPIEILLEMPYSH